VAGAVILGLRDGLGRRTFLAAKAAGGATAWSVSPLGDGSWEEPVPSVRDGVLFVGASDGLLAFGVADGAPLWSVGLPNENGAGSLALGARLVCRGSGSACVDPTTQLLATYTGGTGRRILGGAGGLLYEVPQYSGTVLTARDEATGATSWAWTAPHAAPSYLFWVPIHAQGQVFALGSLVDADTQAATPVPFGGLGAISSNGVGFTFTDGEYGLQLHAVNLH